MPVTPAVLDSGTVYAAITPPTAGNMRKVAVSESGLWVVAGPSGAVYRSSDYGSSWASAIPSTGQMYGMAYGEGLFTLTQDSGNDLYSSPDGSTWTSRISGVSRDHHQVSYNDGYFVLGSGAGGGNGYVFGSAAGTSWTQSPDVGANSVQCGIYSGVLNRTFVAGAQYKYYNGDPTAIIFWSGNPVGLSGFIYDIAWSPTLEVAVAVGSAGIFNSSNLTSWSSVSTGTFYGVAWCNNKFVAVGSGGVIKTSSESVNWTSRTSGTTNALYGVAEYNGVILVTGDAGTALRSSGS